MKIHCYTLFPYTVFLLSNSEGEEDVWYYSTPGQIDEVIDSLDELKWERELVRSLDEAKEEMVRQMNITDELTIMTRGTKKTALEVEKGRYFKTHSKYSIKVICELQVHEMACLSYLSQICPPKTQHPNKGSVWISSSQLSCYET